MQVLSSQSWPREDLVLLLAYLNIHIARIRKEFIRNKKTGTSFATKLLSKRIGKNRSAQGVRNEIERLWNCGGPDIGETEASNPLYLEGAWTRTLPKINDVYPRMLEDVSRKVRLIQSTNRGIYEGSAESKLEDEGEKDVVIECKCIFSHHMEPYTQCKSCGTSQHVYCYYNSWLLQDVPKIHTCERCEEQHMPATQAMVASRGDVSRAEIEESLLEALQKMCVGVQAATTGLVQGTRKERSEFNTPKLRADTANTQSPPTVDEDMFWGPDDPSIKETMESVSYSAGRIAHSISYDFDMLLPEILDDESDLVEVLKFASDTVENFVTSYTTACRPSIRGSQFLSILIGSAIWKWTFYAKVSEVDSMERFLLDQYQKVVFSQYGFKMLQTLRRRAWTSPNPNDDMRMDGIIEKEADSLTRRLLIMLSSIIMRRISGPQSPRTVRDWIDGTPHGKSLFKTLTDTFIVSIRQLRVKLPLSQKFHELYLPRPGTNFNDRFMIDEGGCPSTEGSKVYICVTPAMIEYQPDSLSSQACQSGIFPGECNFISVTDCERAKGRVVCRAVVSVLR